MRRTRAIAVLALVAATAYAGFCQEAKGGSAAAGETKFGFAVGIGTETVLTDPTEKQNDLTNPYVNYQKLMFQPEFSWGKFGLGLDLSVHFNLDLGSGGDGVKFYEPDWIPSKAGKSFFALYLPKIAYVRYAHKGDPLYAKLGSFDDGTLGNGFIMGNYSNTRFLPTTRIFGAAFDLDGSLVGVPMFGVETFVGNVALMDVMGSRIFVRPFTGSSSEMLKQLQIGATVAADRYPNEYDGVDGNDSGDKPALVYGGDFRQPLFANPMATLALFGDAAFENKGRWGTGVGAGGKLFSFMPYTAQLRLLGPGFIPTYFDSSYDLFRAQKYASMQEDPTGSAYAGWLAGLGFSFFQDRFAFKVSGDGPFRAPPKDSVALEDYPHARAVFTIAEGVLGGFSFEALYEKYRLGIDEDLDMGGTGSFWKDLVDPNNAVIAAKVSYHTGPAILSLVYNLHYDPETSSFIVSSSLMTAIQF